MDDVNKILNDYISTHNKTFDFSFINCEFGRKFYNNFIANIKINYFYNTGNINVKRYLINDIDCFKSRGYKFYNINQMIIDVISDRCSMTFENYINHPMSMCERKINMNIAKIPHLITSLGRNKNHPLIRKFLHITFNN